MSVCVLTPVVTLKSSFILRFTAEAKASRNPYYYMPFGVGPRNCIGMRLALAEVKMTAVKILQKFKFVTGPETEVRMVNNILSKYNLALLLVRLVGIAIEMNMRSKQLCNANRFWAPIRICMA